MQSLPLTPARPAFPLPQTFPDPYPRDAYRTPPRRPAARNYSPNRKDIKSPPADSPTASLAAKMAAIRLCF